MSLPATTELTEVGNTVAIDNSIPETRFQCLYGTAGRIATDTPLMGQNALVGLASQVTPIISGRARNVAVATAMALLQLSGLGLSPTRATDPIAARPTPRLVIAKLGEDTPNVSADDTEFLGKTPSERALAAVDDLKTWLGYADYEVAELCGFARRNLVNWKAGRGSYGVATRRLLSTHALVSELVRHLGMAGANVWLQSPNPRWGNTALEELAGGRIDRVLEAADEILFPPSDEAASSPDWLADVPSAADDMVTPVVQEPRANLAHREPRRPRRVPRG